eukprot:PITA_08527
MLDNVGGQEAHLFTNGFSGYHQIKITPEHRSKMTFVIEWGCSQYMVMPFELKNASAVFSHVFIETFKYFIDRFLEIELDGRPYEDGGYNKFGGTKKCETTMHDVGHIGYYRKFIKSYAQITAPMEKLLKKDATFYWNEECERSLDVLKKKMVTMSILVFPD